MSQLWEFSSFVRWLCSLLGSSPASPHQYYINTQSMTSQLCMLSGPFLWVPHTCSVSTLCLHFGCLHWFEQHKLLQWKNSKTSASDWHNRTPFLFIQIIKRVSDRWFLLSSIFTIFVSWFLCLPCSSVSRPWKGKLHGQLYAKKFYGPGLEGSACSHSVPTSIEELSCRATVAMETGKIWYCYVVKWRRDVWNG